MAWVERFASVSGAGAQDGTFGNDWTLAGAIAAVAAGMRVNLLAGTYANGATSRTFATSGTVTSPIWWRGYKANPGDQDGNNLAVAGVDIPSITFGAAAVFSNANNQYWSNLDFAGASTSGALFGGTGAGQVIYGCRFRHLAGATVPCLGLTSGTSAVIRCYISPLSTQAGANPLTGGGILFMGNYFVGGALGIQWWTTGTSNGVIGNVFDSIGGDVIRNTTGYGFYANNAIYAPLGHGFTWSSTPASCCYIMNNHFENVNQSGKAAVNNAGGAASSLIRCISNSYFNCAANIAGQGDIPPIFTLGSLAGSGFVDPVNHNFTALPILQSVGFPGLFEAISAFRGFMDTGAVQAQGGVNIFGGEF